MQQLDLFTTRARATDPQTSHDAAHRLSSQQAAAIRIRIMSQLKLRPHTDEELLDVFEANGWVGSPSGIRTRRSELVDAGHVTDTGERRKTRSGRDSIVWGLS